MSQPILYSFDISPPVLAVQTVAAAIGLELDIRPVDLTKGENRQDWYLKINPQHCVPTLDDNGLVLWDSHAISAYLVDKYAENDCLYPKDLNMRSKINQRLYFDSSVFFAALRLAQFPIFTRGATDVPTHVIDSLYSAFDFLETFLQHDDYLVGNSVTIADLCCVATAYSCLAILDLNNGKYPRVLQWIDRLFELSYVKEVNGNSAKGFRDLIQKQKDEKKA